jgi:hypothetical protein
MRCAKKVDRAERQPAAQKNTNVFSSWNCGLA